MEDTLRAFAAFKALVKESKVLILVLMEDTLRDDGSFYSRIQKVKRLNPCFNGRYSQRE